MLHDFMRSGTWTYVDVFFVYTKKQKQKITLNC